MRYTIFRTPVLRRPLQLLARLILRLSRWRVVGEVPTVPRYVLAAAPHTSNWDFPLMLLAVLDTGIDVRWMGKDTLFRRPFGGLMRWLGGIAIDRSKANRTVDQMISQFRASTQLVVLIPPEGTRSRVERWKTGFYHIANGAEIPILLGFIDAGRRELGFGPLFYPSGDIEQDLTRIQAFYADKRGLQPR